MTTLSCANLCGFGDLASPFRTSASVTCQTVAVVRSTGPDLEALAEAEQPPVTRACPASGVTTRLTNTINHVNDARMITVRWEPTPGGGGAAATAAPRRARSGPAGTGPGSAPTTPP